VSARRLRSRISLTAVTDFSRLASHPFTPRTTHSLGTVQRRWHQHDTILHWKREVIRTHLGDLARARRKFTTSSIQEHGHIDPPKAGEESVFHLHSDIYTADFLVLLRRLHVTFIDKDGDKHTFKVAKGDNLLDIAQANDIEMEGMRWMGFLAF
jgi:hypothetical protein